MKRGMRLKPRRAASPDRKLRLTLPGPLMDELERYRVLYRGTHGDEIELPELIEGILEQFLAGDRFFQKWRREAARSSDRPERPEPRGGGEPER